MSAPCSFNSLCHWLNDRLQLESMLALAQKKTVPIHKHAVWYYLGGIAFIFFLIQVVSGLLLMVYYVPSLEAAHASILRINSQIDFGWFIRSLHSWGANLMIVALFVHLFSTYFMRAYRRPREITWLTGMGLLLLVVGFGFTGYLLPWDEVSFFATKIGLDIAAKTPLIGDTLALLLRGGSEIGQSTLSRFFVIHVGVLPVLLLAGLGIHLMMVQLHGMSVPESVASDAPEEGVERDEPFFPNFVLKDMMVWLLVINLLAAVVSLFPWGIGPEADPFAPAPMGIKPEWYFLAMFQFLKLLPPTVGPLEGELLGILIIGLVVAVLALVPFWDTGRSPMMARLARLFGLLFLIAFVSLTMWGFLS